MGTFIANETKKANHKQYCTSTANVCDNKTKKCVLPVSKYKKKIPHNIRIEPTIVYKKNCKTACILRCRDPQIPIKKNIGITTPSK